MANADVLREAALRIRALAVLRGLRRDAVLGTLLECLDAREAEEERRVELYAAFVAALYAEGGDLGAHLMRLLLADENPAIKICAAGDGLTGNMQASLGLELETLAMLAELTPEDLTQEMVSAPKLARWANTPQDFAGIYGRLMAEAPRRGYGVFASRHMFVLAEGGALLPVDNPDPQRLCELTGYEREREAVLINTRALLDGLAANNILLYGDAGTGKSSTVKAIANEYRGEGLRLVEVRKNQLYQIPALMDKLAKNPLKFILFIDDLSFPADDGDFTELKAILEGNVSARPGNIVVYATSNRRHMLKQRFSDRQGDDLHLGDTLEEEASLAARFGLTITFLRPDRELYGEIVVNLAKEQGLDMAPQQLLALAEAHAIRHGGRSPRTARQFVEYLRAQQGKTED